MKLKVMMLNLLSSKMREFDICFTSVQYYFPDDCLIYQSENAILLFPQQFKIIASSSSISSYGTVQTRGMVMMPITEGKARPIPTPDVQREKESVLEVFSSMHKDKQKHQSHLVLVSRKPKKRIHVRTYPVSFCRTIPPSSRACLPVFPPSTTNRSS